MTVFYNNWQKETLQHFIEGWKKAGVPEWPFGFKGMQKDRLSDREIKALFFGAKIKGYGRKDNPFNAGKFEIAVTADGNFNWTTDSYAIPPKRSEETGTLSIERNELCVIRPKRTVDRKHCAPIFLNPKAEPGKSSTYVWPTIFDIQMFSAAK